MKKLLLTLFVLLFSISIFSQDVLWGKATRLNYRIYGYEWTGWTRQYIDVKWDFANNQLIIYSRDTQILDYWNVNKEYSKGITIYTMNATDTENKQLVLQIFVYNSGGVYIKMLYTDIEYKYELKSLY